MKTFCICKVKQKCWKKKNTGTKVEMTQNYKHAQKIYPFW